MGQLEPTPAMKESSFWVETRMAKVAKLPVVEAQILTQSVAERRYYAIIRLQGVSPFTRWCTW